MKLEIATPTQSLELAEFFRRFPLRGPVEMLVDRKPDFFKPYSIQSASHVTYTLRDERDASLLGSVTFVMDDLWVNGQPQKVAFGRDLRILETRQAVLGWTQHFLPVMNEIQTQHGAQHVFSILSQNDARALNAFVRPRLMRRPIPRYFLFRRFNLVSLHGRLPWAPTPLKSLRIRRGSPAIEDALIQYVVRKSRQRELGTLWDADRFLDRLARWDNLTLEDFLVATDAQGNIVGCCAPWSPGGIEERIPLRYNLIAHNFRQFLKFGKFFGWTRTLTKPVYRLGMEASLNFRYLSFLFADNEDIFDSLAWIAYDECRETEFIAYTQMRSDLHLRPPLSWISAKNAHGLYALVPPEQPLPDFMHPSNDRPVELEPFFI